MKQLYLGFLLLLINFSMPIAMAQNDCWSFMVGNTGFDRVDAITVGDSGIFFVAGIYDGTVDFDPDSGMQALSSSGFAESYIASYDANGAFRFAYAMPGIEVRDLSTDASNNLYITGTYSGTNVDADPGPGVDLLPVFGAGNIFVSSLDKNGNYRWGRGYGSAGPDEGSSIRVDPNQGILVSGNYFLTVDFATSSGTTTLTSEGGTDVFAMKLDIDGIAQYVQSFGGPGFEGDAFIAPTSNSDESYWLTFGFQDSVPLDSGSGPTIVNSNGGFDVMIVRLDSGGQTKDFWSIGGPSDDRPGESVVDIRNGNLFISGIFKDSIDGDPSGDTHMLKSQGEDDVFLFSYTPSGIFNTGSSAGGPAFDSSPGLDIIGPDFNNAKLLLTGEFDSLARISSGSTAPPIILTSNGFFDSYMAWYDPVSGALQGVRQFGGMESDVGLKARPDGLYVDLGDVFDLAKSRTIIVGNSSGSLDLNPSGDSCRTPMVHTAQGVFDFFVGSISLFSDSVTTGLPDIDPLAVRIFPNPVSIYLTLEIQTELHPASRMEVEIFDLQGREVIKEVLRSGEMGRISVRALPEGMFVVRVRDEQGRRYVGRFVKR